DKISVFKRNVKTKNYDEITPAVFHEKYQLNPDQMIDFLGLMGDTSDNIPGIPGVGEKTALKLLHEYGSVEGILENKDAIKGKLGEKVRDNSDLAILSKEVATIMQDVPIDIDIEDLVNTKHDYDTLADFYRKYDMQSLLKRMAVKEDNVTVKAQETKVDIVNTMPTITKTSAVVVGVYEQNYHKSPILGYAVYNDEQSLFISFEDALKDEEFKKYLQDKTKEKLGYDIKKSSIASTWNSVPINGYIFDLQLASYILNPSLKDEVRNVSEFYQYEDVLYDEEVYGKGAKKAIPEVDKVANHLIKQAKAIYALKEQAVKKLKEDNQLALYEEVELPVAHILSEMEFQGAKLDVPYLKNMQQEFNDKITVLEKEIITLAGRPFNVGSPKQLGEILFEDLELPHGKKTKTGYSTSVDVLQKLRLVHPIIDLILEYRSLTKLYSTYIVGLQEQVFLDGKIHTIYNQALTKTGRLSSIDPNLQNIPVKTEEGKLIRKAFIPEYDYLVSFDYSQIELRVLAHLAGAKSLIEAFNRDEDIHRHTASEVFGVSEDDVDSTMRRNAKAVNFGIIYGMSDFGLSEQIGVSVAEARSYIQKYFQQFPEIKTYMDKTIEFCKENEYVATLLNRKCFIPEINSSNYMRQEGAKRLSMNSQIQGSAADILKLEM
ncbi:MAG: DNA polymerase I, partial [Coprobacillaceae bacterium]